MHPSILAAAAVDVGPRVALHALNRMGFGPTPGDVRDVLGHGIERYLEEQLQPGPDPELQARLQPFRTLSYTTSQILALYNADERSIGPVVDEFVAARVIRAVHSKNQLQEVLVDFWFNHFNVNIADGFVRYAIMSYERDALRPHVLGRFRDLLGATAAHPAMLFYLDNYLSTASRVDPRTGRLIQGLNENYGRELLELHTVSVDAGYTQEHVFDAARCFTGWGIDSIRAGGNFVFRPPAHDTGAKSVFGLAVPAGGQKEDGDRLLDYLAAHPSTAAFIAKKLAWRFVSDDPPARLVDRMAAAYLASDGTIADTLRAMLSSPDFWAEGFGPGKARTPLEYAVGALRASGAQVTGARGVAAALAAMGMPLYQCIPPTGYSSRGVDWLNPSSHLHRMNFALDLTTGALPGVAVDARSVVRELGGNPEDPRSSTDAVAAGLFANNVSAETRQAAAAVSRTGPVPVAARVLALMLASPEMQVR